MNMKCELKIILKTNKKVAKCLFSSEKSYNFATENRKKDDMSKQYASFYYFYFYFAGHCEAGSRI